MEILDNIKGAIFDLDGTMLDSMWVWHEVDNRFLSVRGHEVPFDYMGAINHMTLQETAIYTISRFGLMDTPQNLIDEWIMLAKNAYEREVVLKPNVREYIEQLSSNGIKLSVATALQEELALAALASCGVLQYFSSITNVSEVTRGKSYPDVYIKAADKMGLMPCDCVVFEDILVGIMSAKSGGFKTVGVYDESSSSSMDKIKRVADIYIYDFIELMQ